MSLKIIRTPPTTATSCYWCPPDIQPPRSVRAVAQLAVEEGAVPVCQSCLDHLEKHNLASTFEATVRQELPRRLQTERLQPGDQFGDLTAVARVSDASVDAAWATWTFKCKCGRSLDALAWKVIGFFAQRAWCCCPNCPLAPLRSACFEDETLREHTRGPLG